MEDKLVSKRTGSQFLKFIVVGVINTGLDWLAFFLLTMSAYFGQYEVLAKAISFVVAAINSFLMNSYWTFRKEYLTGLEKAGEKKVAKGSGYFVRFMIVSLIGWGLNTLIFYLMREYFVADLAETTSRLVSLFFASGVVTVWNFLANKLWTYK